MAVEYKVWAHIERVDEDEDTYGDIALPDCLRTFASQTEAEEYVLGLLLVSNRESIGTSDQVPRWARRELI